MQNVVKCITITDMHIDYAYEYVAMAMSNSVSDPLILLWIGKHFIKYLIIDRCHTYMIDAYTCITYNYIILSVNSYRGLNQKVAFMPVTSAITILC